MFDFADIDDSPAFLAHVKRELLHQRFREPQANPVEKPVTNVRPIQSAALTQPLSTEAMWWHIQR
jgi:hypothetical protein